MAGSIQRKTPEIFEKLRKMNRPAISRRPSIHLFRLNDWTTLATFPPFPYGTLMLLLLEKLLPVLSQAFTRIV
jgi:hypothetical protein